PSSSVGLNLLAARISKFKCNSRGTEMSRFVPFVAMAAIALSGTAARGVRAAEASCDSIAVQISAGRKAGDVERLPPLLAQAREIKSGCAERALLCLGRSVTL